MKKLLTKVLGKICFWWALRLHRKHGLRVVLSKEYLYFAKFCNIVCILEKKGV